MHISVYGIVQGVGFRPFVHQLAGEIGLTGTVQNQAGRVAIAIQGQARDLGRFLRRLKREHPPAARIQKIEANSRRLPNQNRTATPAGSAFRILASEPGGSRLPVIPPDLAPCPDCLRELLDPAMANRRYGYPFLACTNCGPRHSTILDLPYDRSRTTMCDFPLCDACRREYQNPHDRRFHAQATACPDCGPQLRFENPNGAVLARRTDALDHAIRLLGAGGILAVKGVGGFQLIAEASDGRAIVRLRRRKRRPRKAFALLYPNIEELRADCLVSAAESRLLAGPAAPIVLLRRLATERPDAGPLRIARQVAPDNPCLGVMLPASPLHAVLCHRFARITGRRPVFVATSGNAAGEPMCIEDGEARERLGHIADAFLTHNRRIARPLDDSLLQVVDDRPMTLRRGRGMPAYTARLKAPDSVRDDNTRSDILACGAHLKNTVAVVNQNGVAILSPHIGDMDDLPAFDAHLRARADLLAFYAIDPHIIAADAHPDYRSTISARSAAEQTDANSARKLKRFSAVQHHHAHALAACVEHALRPDEVVAVVFDGLGLGPEAKLADFERERDSARLWGGEILLPGTAGAGTPGFHRFAHLRGFPLPGGEAAAREPRRAALGLLYEIFGDAVFSNSLHPGTRALFRWFRSEELTRLRRMLNRGWNCPRTTSAGRLFDAVAALAGLRGRNSFEGDAAMALEFAARRAYAESSRVPGESPFPSATGPRPDYDKDILINRSSPRVLDWEPLVRTLLRELEAPRAAAGGPLARERVALRFHRGLAHGILAIVQQACDTTGRPVAVLCGGCFQNRLLLEITRKLLTRAAIRTRVPEAVPPGDGGVALGQAAAAFYSQFERDTTGRDALQKDSINSKASAPNAGY